MDHFVGHPYVRVGTCATEVHSEHRFPGHSHLPGLGFFAHHPGGGASVSDGLGCDACFTTCSKSVDSTTHSDGRSLASRIEVRECAPGLCAPVLTLTHVDAGKTATQSSISPSLRTGVPDRCNITPTSLEGRSPPGLETRSRDRDATPERLMSRCSVPGIVSGLDATELGLLSTLCDHQSKDQPSFPVQR